VLGAFAPARTAIRPCSGPQRADRPNDETTFRQVASQAPVADRGVIHVPYNPVTRENSLNHSPDRCNYGARTGSHRTWKPFPKAPAALQRSFRVIPVQGHKMPVLSRLPGPDALSRQSGLRSSAAAGRLSASQRGQGGRRSHPPRRAPRHHQSPPLPRRGRERPREPSLCPLRSSRGDHLGSSILPRTPEAGYFLVEFAIALIKLLGHQLETLEGLLTSHWIVVIFDGEHLLARESSTDLFLVICEFPHNGSPTSI
jgi:hypothetical protein